MAETRRESAADLPSKRVAEERRDSQSALTSDAGGRAQLRGLAGRRVARLGRDLESVVVGLLDRLLSSGEGGEDGREGVLSNVGSGGEGLSDGGEDCNMQQNEEVSSRRMGKRREALDSRPSTRF